MSFAQGFSPKKDKEGHKYRKAFGVGTVVGAAANIGHDAYLNHRERKVSNTKSIKALRQKMKPGDIILTGTTARHAGGWDVSDLPKPVQKVLKTFGLKDEHTVINNSRLLTSLGVGGKYHAGIYLGKGRMGEMLSDVGASSNALKDTLVGQNTAVYRFKDAKKKEVSGAIGWTKKMIKKKEPYKTISKTAPLAITNLLSPIGAAISRKNKNGMVCSTLPLRAYHKRKFSLQGEHTFSGDIRKAKNLVPVARRDVVKLPFGQKARGVVGQGLKGLKWGLGAAALAGIATGAQAAMAGAQSAKAATDSN